jgi:hypothetical protein
VRSWRPRRKPNLTRRLPRSGAAALAPRCSDERTVPCSPGSC